MRKLKLMREPRALAAFLLTPPLAASPLFLLSMKVTGWAYVSMVLYFSTIMIGVPLYEWLRGSRRPRLVSVVALTALASGGLLLLIRGVILLAMMRRITLDPATYEPSIAILLTGVYAILAALFGAVGGVIFWLIAFAGADQAST